MTSTQKTPRAEFLWATAHMKKKLLYLTSARKTPWAEFLWANAHMKKTTAPPMLTQKTQWAEFLWAKRSLEENPLLYWHQHGRLHGRNSYGRTLTWRKTTAPPMLTQKTLWAEFLWAKRLYKKKNPWLPWHLHRRLRGQNSYGRMLTWRKKLLYLTSARKTPWAEFLWANAHMKKNHGSTDVNTEDTMGRILMGETLVQNLMGHLIGNS